ncbi:hypothetical protein [Polycladospora coralii]|nr:hypothetical protein [Polycladospora coralii]
MSVLTPSEVKKIEDQAKQEQLADRKANEVLKEINKTNLKEWAK